MTLKSNLSGSKVLSTLFHPTPELQPGNLISKHGHDEDDNDDDDDDAKNRKQFK